MEDWFLEGWAAASLPYSVVGTHYNTGELPRLLEGSCFLSKFALLINLIDRKYSCSFYINTLEAKVTNSCQMVNDLRGDIDRLLRVIHTHTVTRFLSSWVLLVPMMEVFVRQHVLVAKEQQSKGWVLSTAKPNNYMTVYPWCSLRLCCFCKYPIMYPIRRHEPGGTDAFTGHECPAVLSVLRRSKLKKLHIRRARSYRPCNIHKIFEVIPAFYKRNLTGQIWSNFLQSSLFLSFRDNNPGLFLKPQGAKSGPFGSHCLFLLREIIFLVSIIWVFWGLETW